MRVPKAAFSGWAIGLSQTINIDSVQAKAPSTMRLCFALWAKMGTLGLRC